jgi:hypothetical protein
MKFSSSLISAALFASGTFASDEHSDIWKGCHASSLFGHDLVDTCISLWDDKSTLSVGADLIINDHHFPLKTISPTTQCVGASDILDALALLCSAAGPAAPVAVPACLAAIKKLTDTFGKAVPITAASICTDVSNVDFPWHYDPSVPTHLSGCFSLDIKILCLMGHCAINKTDKIGCFDHTIPPSSPKLTVEDLLLPSSSSSSLRGSAY